jgi:beta-glucosidase
MKHVNLTVDRGSQAMRPTMRLICLGTVALAACLRPPMPGPSAPSAMPTAVPTPAGPVIYRNPDRPLEARVADLVARLTLAEKASLLIDKAPGIERLGIRKYDAWNEALHGVAWRDGVTVFPQAIGLASTWDPDLMHRVATAISTEARALYNAGTFGLTLWTPVINIARDPRWGRTQEGYGEDPYLVSRMAIASVTGIQGDHPFYLRAVATPTVGIFAVSEGPRSHSSSA